MAKLEHILVKPLITEKASSKTDTQNLYGFQVKLDATKSQIKNAIEMMFDVRVLAVRTNITPGKVKRAGRYMSKSSPVKKAIVQIEKGQKIEFFKGI
jgi:large subunit ribosomal protein L23